VTVSLGDAAVRGLRPARPAVDPMRAHGVVLEDERALSGGVESTLTVFLAGYECPFSCVFCDLWRYTTEEATPEGAIPAQLEEALGGCASAPVDRIKLYNAANFFDPTAVPVADYGRIAQWLERVPAATVESHPKLLGERCLAFAHEFGGRLEVAMGLETVHPTALPRLNKGVSLDDFDRAADFLAEHDIDLRAFVLLGTPFVAREEQLEWGLRSVEHAIRAGARFVTLIPLRGGNGALEELARSGDYEPPSLDLLEAALGGALSSGALSVRESSWAGSSKGAVVTADVWDLETFASCPECRAERRSRIERINRSGSDEALGHCVACGWGA